MRNDSGFIVVVCIVLLIIGSIAAYFIANSNLPVWMKFWLLK